MVKFSKEAAGSCPCGFFLSIFLVWCGQAQSGHIPEAVEDLERLGLLPKQSHENRYCLWC